MGFFTIWAHGSPDEEMLVSREFLQKLAGKKLKGFFFRDDRSFDLGELSGHLSRGELTFTQLELAHTNFLGIRDMGVTVVPSRNRISLEHLISSIRTAVKRGKPAREEGAPPMEAPPRPNSNGWSELRRVTVNDAPHPDSRKSAGAPDAFKNRSLAPCRASWDGTGGAHPLFPV